jgi:hypothetical protein
LVYFEDRPTTEKRENATEAARRREGEQEIGPNAGPDAHPMQKEPGGVPRSFSLVGFSA